MNGSFYVQLTKDMKIRLEEEGLRYSLTEKKREGRRIDMLLQFKQMIEERETLKSRKEYCRAVRGGTEAVDFNSFEAESFNATAENLKAVMKRLEDVSTSLRK